MSFLKFKIRIYGQELSFIFIFNTACGLSTFLKTHEANLNMQNVILYLRATRHQERAPAGEGPAGWVPVWYWHTRVRHMGMCATHSTLVNWEDLTFMNLE